MQVGEVDIWQEIISEKNLTIAFEKVRKNGGCSGGDGVTIEEFSALLSRIIRHLRAELLDGTYEAGECRQFLIPKKNGTARKLTVPSIRDRVLHTSIANVLTPILEPHFEESSFAYRPGRSVKQAVAAIEKWRKQGYKHVVESDIEDYFNSINHEKLLFVLEKVLPDTQPSRELIGFLTMELSHQAEQLESVGEGILQGSPLSPLLANLYLDVLDEEIEAKGIRIVRFADDFVILCKKLKQTELALENLRDILARLGLKMNLAKTRIVDFDKGFEFLGYLFVRSLALKKASSSGNPEKTYCTFSQSGQIDEPIEFVSDGAKSGESTSKFPNESKRHATGDRVLYVLEKGRKIYIDDHTIYVETLKKNEVMSLAVNRVDQIVLGSQIDVDRDLLEFCAGNKLGLTLLNGRGDLQAHIVGSEDDRAALQFAQSKHCHDKFSATILSRKMVEARIRNQRTQLFRLNRRQDDESVNSTLKQMKYHLRKLPHMQNVDQIRGIEGACGAQYWPALAKLCQGSSYPFKRSRPAKDPLNATINYLTAMLTRDIRSAVQISGLHSGFGFLHKPRDYSQAAVYDLMEPFRAPLTEGLAIFLFNANRLRPEMFMNKDDGTTRIDYKAQRAIIKAYEQALEKRIKITGSSRKLAWRMMMRRQALDLAKAYRKGNVSLFQPYLMEA